MLSVRVCASACLYPAQQKRIPVLTVAFGYYNDIVSLIFYHFFFF